MLNTAILFIVSSDLLVEAPRAARDGEASLL
jgi:hypothetical protein